MDIKKYAIIISLWKCILTSNHPKTSQTPFCAQNNFLNFLKFLEFIDISWGFFFLVLPDFSALFFNSGLTRHRTNAGVTELPPLVEPNGPGQTGSVLSCQFVWVRPVKTVRLVWSTLGPGLGIIHEPGLVKWNSTVTALIRFKSECRLRYSRRKRAPKIPISIGDPITARKEARGQPVYQSNFGLWNSRVFGLDKWHALKLHPTILIISEISYFKT